MGTHILYGMSMKLPYGMSMKLPGKQADRHTMKENTTSTDSVTGCMSASHLSALSAISVFP